MSDSARQFVDLGAVDYDAWVPLSEAAQKLDRSVGQLRRQCKDKLAPRGVAFHMAPNGGGQRVWHIHVSHDARLLRGPVGDANTAPDLSMYTQQQRADTFARVACVEAFRRARRGDDPLCVGPATQWMGTLIAHLRREHTTIKISQTSLYEWHRKYNCPADTVKLIDHRGGDRRSGQQHKRRARCIETFKGYYLDQRGTTLREAWRQTRAWAQANGLADAWVSEATCGRKLDEWIPAEVQLMHRDPSRWRDTCAPRIVGAHADLEPGRIWMGDHGQCDFFCWWQNTLIRPWVTVWMDGGTRRVVAAVLCVSPSSDTILAAFGDGMRDPANMGGPTRVHVDNGKDYQALTFHGQTRTERRRTIIKRGEHCDEQQFAGIFAWLGIEVGFSLPYNPTGKSFVERWFGTQRAQFDKTFWTYRGKDTTSKPEQLADILKRGRDIPTFEHVAARLKDFVAAYNANADHQMQELRDHPGPDGMLSPDQAMQQWAARMIPKDPGAIDLVCRHWHKPVTVGKHGVRIAPLGVPLSYDNRHDLSLAEYRAPARKGRKKTRVLVSYDPADMRTVQVWTLDGRFVCVAESPLLGDLPDAVTRDHLAQQQRENRQYAKALKAVRQFAPREYRSAAELIRDAVVAEHVEERLAATGTDDATPGPLKLRQTAVDGQSSAAQRAHAQANARPVLSMAGRHPSSTPKAGPLSRRPLIQGGRSPRVSTAGRSIPRVNIQQLTRPKDQEDES